MNYPLVSIIIPSYNSHQTIERSLTSFIEQNYKGEIEIIVVDSSSDNMVSEIMKSKFSTIKFFHHKKRLYPHDARNLGTQHARGKLIVFSDPDIYAPQDWVDILVKSYNKYNGVIVGSLKCFNKSWLKTGIHITKFDIWLPGNKTREIKISPTANMIIDGNLLESIGYFKKDEFLGDTLLSWHIKEKGETIMFVPEAFVYHDHTSNFTEFLKERYIRGNIFGRMRIRKNGGSNFKILLMLMISIFPIRLLKLNLRTGYYSYESKHFCKFIITQPVILCGIYAWLFGESVAFLNKLIKIN